MKSKLALSALLVYGCSSSDQLSTIKSGYPDLYPMRSYQPQLTLPFTQGVTKRVEITQIFQKDEGVGYEIIYRGPLVSEALNIVPNMLPDIRLTFTVSYSQSLAETYTVSGSSPQAFANKDSVRFYLSSTCVEGRYGGCKTKAPEAMAKALSPGVAPYQTLREAAVELSFTNEQGQKDDIKGLNYLAFFVMHKGYFSDATPSALSLPGNILIEDIGGGSGLGCYGLCGFFAAEILVKNLGLHKNVGIVYQYLDTNLQALETKTNWEMVGQSSSLFA